jgi:signal transduction histidine kinase
MIERHDGTIAVANRPGGGVLFTIRLPVKAEGTTA